MALNRRKLKEWVSRKVLARPRAESFSLWHVGRHAPNLVSQLAYKCDGAGDLESSIEKQVSQEVSDHIEAWPGRQQYIVKAFDSGEREIAEYPFSLNSRESHTDSASALTMPTPEMESFHTGQLGGDFSHPSVAVSTQQMRHNEALMRYVVDLSAMSRERDAQIIVQQQRALDKMEQRRFESVELIEEMYSRRHERQITQQSHDDDNRRKEQLLEKLTTVVLPAIAQRVSLPPRASSSNGTPSDAEARVDSIRSIFTRLPAEMQNELVASLNDEDREALLSIFQNIGGEQHQAAATEEHDSV